MEFVSFETQTKEKRSKQFLELIKRASGTVFPPRVTIEAFTENLRWVDSSHTIAPFASVSDFPDHTIW